MLMEKWSWMPLSWMEGHLAVVRCLQWRTLPTLWHWHGQWWKRCHHKYSCFSFKRRKSVILIPLFLWKLLDCTRHADKQRCKPVCREHRHGHSPHWYTGDWVWEGRMGQAQELCYWSNGRFQLSVVSFCGVWLYFDPFSSGLKFPHKSLHCIYSAWIAYGVTLYWNKIKLWSLLVMAWEFAVYTVYKKCFHKS